jgi:hypothetical protein
MSTKLSAAILFACLCIVGMLEQQDYELSQQMAAERLPAKVARR